MICADYNALLNPDSFDAFAIFAIILFTYVNFTLFYSLSMSFASIPLSQVPLLH